MRKFWTVLFALIIALTIGAPGAFAGSTVLYDWVFNINGNAYESSGAMPAEYNAGLSSFDFMTGLGTIIFDYRPPTPGNYLFMSFFDHEIDEETNGAMNEYGGPSTITPPPGMSFEIDEPGWTPLPGSEDPGDIYWNVVDSTSTLNALDNSNALTSTNPFDASMALGSNFSLSSGQHALITVLLTTSPQQGFALEQHDADSDTVVYFSQTVNISDLPPDNNVPEPGTLVLLGGGLIALAAIRTRKRK